MISHTTFWQRYYFKVFQLENEERKREELLARANVNTEGDNDVDDEDGGWGDDDDGIFFIGSLMLFLIFMK